MRGDKATVRFSNPMEEKFFQNTMVSMRDSITPHPKVTVKDRDGDVPPLPKTKPIGKPIIVKPKPLVH